MKGDLYIDGIDAFEKFGVFVANGGYAGMVQWPSLKTPDQNDWPEEDGVEVDLTNPLLDSKIFQTQLAYNKENYNYAAMVEMLADGAYHDFDFREAGVQRQLRMTQSPNLQAVQHLGFFSLEFADDFPLQGYSYVAPATTTYSTQEYEIYDHALADYGVQVVDGTLNEIRKAPDTKQNLLQNTKAMVGAAYDSESVFFKDQDVKIGCVMRASTLAEFWQNWNALLFDLVRVGERTLYYAPTFDELPCYYKSCSVKTFTKAGGVVWCDFTITLCLTRPRPATLEYVLSTEDGRLIVAENYNAIEMKKP